MDHMSNNVQLSFSSEQLRTLPISRREQEFCRYNQVIMGKHFGELYKMRGIITYRLSPFEQRPFAGIISHGIPNTVRRIRGNILQVGIPFLLGYMVFSWGEAEHERLQRKNPADYANDV